MKRISSQLRKELTDILVKLIRIESENPPGRTEQVVDYLVKHVFSERNGYRHSIVTHTKESILLHNLISETGSGDTRIILSGHFDTVPAGDAGQWTYPPFSGQIANGQVYGRGASDMKGGIVALIGAMKLLQQDESFMRKNTLVFVGTADEEAGMSGSARLAETGVMQDADMLIIAEPTDMLIGIAEKGVVWVEATVRGKAAHGSQPEEGINAVELAGRIMPELRGCTGGKVSPLLGTSTLNIGYIRGGSAFNIVPDKAVMGLDYRIIPEDNPDDIIEKLKKLSAGGNPLEIKIKQVSAALKTDEKHPFIRNLREVSGSRTVGLPYGTDAKYLINGDNPTPFVIYGPGKRKVIHQKDEYIELDALFQAAGNLAESLHRTYG